MRTYTVEALRALMPDSGSNAHQLADLAQRTVFDVRDESAENLIDRLRTGTNPPSRNKSVKDRLAYYERRAGYLAHLAVALAAMVDVDATPTALLAWVPGPKPNPQAQEETVRMIGARREAALVVEAEVHARVVKASGNTLPPVTLQTILNLATLADLAGVPHPCGTIGAWRRHIGRGEPPCARCATAREIYDAAMPADRERFNPHAGQLNQPCGSRAAYKRHKLDGEDPCGPCTQANTDYNDARYEAKLRREGKVRQRARNTAAVGRPRTQHRDPSKLEPCGSNAGYSRHQRNREDPCDPCKQAHSEYGAQWRENRASQPPAGLIELPSNTGPDLSEAA